MRPPYANRPVAREQAAPSEAAGVDGLTLDGHDQGISGCRKYLSRWHPAVWRLAVFKRFGGGQEFRQATR
jgi:hypothetical protein